MTERIQVPANLGVADNSDPEVGLLADARALNQQYAMWAHEMRTPLWVIEQALAQLSPSLTSNQQACLGLAQTALTQAQQGLNDVLTLSQLQQTRVQVQSAPFLLNEIWQALTQSGALLAAEKNLAWRVKPLERSIWLRGDGYRLQQILLNLISNAIKFTPAGGWVALDFALDGSCAVWRVSDSGVGLDQQALAELGQPFHQFVQSASAHAPGSGLGLYIVKQLLALMGGALSVSSQPGEGSCFTLSLPWVEVVDTPSDWVAKTEVTDVCLRVLLVDDSVLAREVVKQTLPSFLQVDWLEASSLAQAKALLLARSVDVVVSDQQLAEGRGSDLCQWLVQQGELGALAGLPFFVLLSAEPVVNDCAQAHFVKPLSTSHWLTILDGVKKRQAKKTEKSKKIVCKKVIHDKIPSVLTELLPKFASEMRAGLGDLEQALAVADWARMSELTHKIKGSCMLFGLQSWVEMLLILQAAVSSQSSSEAKAQLEMLRAAVASFDA